jgi:hypothetical protein
VLDETVPNLILASNIPDSKGNLLVLNCFYIEAWPAISGLKKKNNNASLLVSQLKPVDKQLKKKVRASAYRW